MPNANGNDTKEMLMQVESEIRQISSQISAINATIKPYLTELNDLRDYHKQLTDLQETLQRRTIKPRVVVVERKVTTKTTTTSLDPSSQQLIDIMKRLSAADLEALTAQINLANGEMEN